jgi:flagellar hook assembly protein FlgD
LTNPSLEERLLNFSQELLFVPASDAKNRSHVVYRPSLSEDGIYKLRVQARDKSGNASASIDYQISFEVINQSTITEVLNFPNPFSTSTQFVFTITGTEVPDEMKIQIMTVGGEVVREIMGGELGPLHIGRNLTSYRWNATDEFGDRLANGVYLYRVLARLHGQEIETRSTEVSGYFNRGFGKMVIIR